MMSARARICHAGLVLLIALAALVIGPTHSAQAQNIQDVNCTLHADLQLHTHDVNGYGYQLCLTTIPQRIEVCVEGEWYFLGLFPTWSSLGCKQKSLTVALLDTPTDRYGYWHGKYRYRASVRGWGTVDGIEQPGGVAYSDIQTVTY
jgi:hypothetical protein